MYIHRIKEEPTRQVFLDKVWAIYMGDNGKVLKRTGRGIDWNLGWVPHKTLKNPGLRRELTVVLQSYIYITPLSINTPKDAGGHTITMINDR